MLIVAKNPAAEGLEKVFLNGSKQRHRTSEILDTYDRTTTTSQDNGNLDPSNGSVHAFLSAERNDKEPDMNMRGDSARLDSPPRAAFYVLASMVNRACDLRPSADES